MTRLWAVACSSIVFVSSISTKKTDLPSRILSLAPNQVKILSIGVKMHSLAGTYAPNYANMAATQTYQIKVDFPPIFGPVMSKTWGFYSS